MHSPPVQDAKARFSDFIDAGLAQDREGNTRRGAEPAVLVPADERRRLSEAARPSFMALLLQDGARSTELSPERRAVRRRRVVAAL